MSDGATFEDVILAGAKELEKHNAPQPRWLSERVLTAAGVPDLLAQLRAKDAEIAQQGNVITILDNDYRRLRGALEEIEQWASSHPRHAYVIHIMDIARSALSEGEPKTERKTCEHGVTVDFECNECSVRAGHTVIAAEPVVPAEGDADDSPLLAEMRATCTCGPVPNDGRWDDPDCPWHGSKVGPAEGDERQGLVCPNGRNHRAKFNGGNPVCLTCGAEPVTTAPAAPEPLGTCDAHFGPHLKRVGTQIRTRCENWRPVAPSDGTAR